MKKTVELAVQLTVCKPFDHRIMQGLSYTWFHHVCRV